MSCIVWRALYFYLLVGSNPEVGPVDFILVGLKHTYETKNWIKLKDKLSIESRGVRSIFCICYELQIQSTSANSWAAPHKERQVDGQLGVVSHKMDKQIDNYGLQPKSPFWDGKHIDNTYWMDWHMDTRVTNPQNVGCSPHTHEWDNLHRAIALGPSIHPSVWQNLSAQ